MTGSVPPALAARLAYERAQARQAWDRAEQAASPQESRPWLERAYRFTPSDKNIAFALASLRAATGDPASARRLFARLAEHHDSREVLAGLAACALACGDVAAARAALARALSRATPGAALPAIAAAAQTAWCGLTLDGQLTGTLEAADAVSLDSHPVSPDADGRLPAGWTSCRVLSVTRHRRDLLGSPIDIQAVTRLEGFVERTPEGARGWAWHPGAPDVDPLLRVTTGGATHELAARDLTVAFTGTAPLARPRGFTIACPRGAVVQVTDALGHDVLGSPAGGRATPRRAPPPRASTGAAVIVSVYRGLAQTLACLDSVLATLGADDRLIVVNDASPEAPLSAALATLAAASRRITLITHTRNQGFPAAANTGLRAARGADAVLLNSDTIVHPGWLAALREAAHSAPDIGTATPLSNDASIFTYPAPGAPAPMLDAANGAALAAHALAANAGLTVDVPTGHGFCLYIRADCLHATGLLRPELFAQGYGEENDFCERARAKGWRHVAAPAVYVGHEGGVSFGTARHHLLARNAAIIDRLYPDYHARIAAFIAADPLADARARIDTARCEAGADRDAVLLITHAGHGGTTRFVAERAALHRAAGRRPIVLRGSFGISTLAEHGQDTPNLRFVLSRDAEKLAALLARARLIGAEVHHVQGHAHDVPALLARLRISYDVWIHDYLWLCARLALVTGEARFCGEPPVEVCNKCVARWGDGLEVPATPAALRAEGRALLEGASSVTVPSPDVARRVVRHSRPARLIEAAWEPDPPPRAARLAPRAGRQALTVAVIGAIGLEKGYDIVLACAADARDRGLPLFFTLVGFTPDDTPLLATGHAFVTGPFRAADARATIQAAGAHCAFIPSIWPETWCYALSDAWDADLDAVVFDIGTPAERVRRTGRGWVLPLGLPPPRVNDALLNLQGPASRSSP